LSVRIGIVGCGAIAPTHAEAISRIPEASISGFYDVVEEKAACLAERFQSKAASSLEGLFGASDAIAICVPSGAHAEIGIQAALSGNHVLVEKPIDVSLEQADRLVQECRRTGVKLSVISQHRFAPDIRRAKDALDAGEFGQPIQGDAYIKWFRTQAYYDSGGWRGTWELDGGGCLINQGIHYIDMIQWIMGGVKAVTAICRTAAHEIEVEDVAAALIEYKNGAIGVIQGSTSFFPGFAERLEIHGTVGSAMIEGDDLRAWEIRTEDDGSPYGRGVQSQPTPNLRLSSQEPVSPLALTPAERWIEQHRLQIDDFVQSIVHDREPFITGEDALEPLRVVLAIYESSRRRERVEIPTG
jgi:UDP-N-acetyl-2-amino-2-deoxyglucuronate dehydrogenase